MSPQPTAAVMKAAQGCRCPRHLGQPTESGQVWTVSRPRRPSRPQGSHLQPTRARSVRGSVPVFLSGPSAGTCRWSVQLSKLCAVISPPSLVTRLLWGESLPPLGLSFLIGEMRGWDPVFFKRLPRQPYLAGMSFSQV